MIPAQHDVLGYGHRVHESEMLMDHADARGDRHARRMIHQYVAVENDPPAVRPDHAEQNLHEGTFAGAVLT